MICTGSPFFTNVSLVALQYSPSSAARIEKTELSMKGQFSVQRIKAVGAALSPQLFVHERTWQLSDSR
jgi:hypothetical protein